jgi:hypothetical protein
MIDLKDPLDPTDPLLDPARNRHVLVAARRDADPPRRRPLRPVLAVTAVAVAAALAGLTALPGDRLDAKAALVQAARQMEDVTSARIVVISNHRSAHGYSADATTETRFEGDRLAMHQELDEILPGGGTKPVVTDYVEADGARWFRRDGGEWSTFVGSGEAGGLAEGRRVTRELRDGGLVELMRRAGSAVRDGDTIRATVPVRELQEIGNLPVVLRGPVGIDGAIPPAIQPERPVELSVTLDGDVLRAVDMRITGDPVSAHRRVEYHDLNAPQGIEAP